MCDNKGPHTQKIAATAEHNWKKSRQSHNVGYPTFHYRSIAVYRSTSNITTTCAWEYVAMDSNTRWPSVRQICHAPDGNFEQLHQRQNFVAPRLFCWRCHITLLHIYFSVLPSFCRVSIYSLHIATTPYSKEILQRWRQCGPAHQGRKRRARKAILARWSTQKSHMRSVPQLLSVSWL